MVIGLLFISLAGGVLFFFELANYRARQKFIADFLASQAVKNVAKEVKRAAIENFFLLNGFAKQGDAYAKKEFFLGLFLFFGVFLLVGSLLYLLYFYKFQRPKIYRINLDAKQD